jgi:hypothetical protein
MNKAAKKFKENEENQIDLESHYLQNEVRIKHMAAFRALEEFKKLNEEYLKSLRLEMENEESREKLLKKNNYELFEAKLESDKKKRDHFKVFRSHFLLTNLLLKDWEIIYQKPFIIATEPSELKNLQKCPGVFCVGVKLLKSDHLFLCSFGDSSIFRESSRKESSSDEMNWFNEETGFGFQTKERDEKMCWHFSEFEDASIGEERSTFQLKKFEKIILRKKFF